MPPLTDSRHAYPACVVEAYTHRCSETLGTKHSSGSGAKVRHPPVDRQSHPDTVVAARPSRGRSRGTGRMPASPDAIHLGTTPGMSPAETPDPPPASLVGFEVKRETDALGLALLAALVRVHTADPVLLVCHDGVALPIRWVGHGPGRSDRTYTRARLVGHARPAGAVTMHARAGLISPSATQQGASQVTGHDPRAPIPPCMSEKRCNWPKSLTELAGRA
jgi:hypothetical protein